METITMRVTKIVDGEEEEVVTKVELPESISKILNPPKVEYKGYAVPTPPNPIFDRTMLSDVNSLSAAIESVIEGEELTMASFALEMVQARLKFLGYASGFGMSDVPMFYSK